MFTYMARGVIWEKESFRAIQVTLLASIALKSWTCGKSVKDRNSIKYDIYLTKVHLKCNYLNYVDSPIHKVFKQNMVLLQLQ